MAVAPPNSRTPLPATWLASPLSPPRLIAVSVLLVAGGALYCTLYCLIAFPPMHHGMMPVSYSAIWATFTFLPWFLAFEGAKRAMNGRGASRAARGAALTVAAACCSVGLELIANGYFDVRSRPLPFQVADQLPAFLVTAMAIGLGIWQRGLGRVADARDHESPLPPPDQIEWITAAGNYVEIRSGARLLIRRLTMREAEALLDPVQFLRIHRSALINRSHVEEWRSRTVRMRDGTILRVGDSHRRKLAAVAG